MNRSRPRRLALLAAVLPSSLALAALVALVALPVPASAAKRPRPALAVSAAAPRAALDPGQTASVKVTVRNRSGARVRGAVLRVTPAAGVAATLSGARRGRLTVTLPAIKARGSRALTLKLTPTEQARDGARTAIRLSAGRRHASTSVPLRLTPRAPLAGRWYWAVQYAAFGNLDNLGLYFVDGRWAYRGMPRGGLPTCTAQTAVGDGDGCLPYSFDPRTNAVSVGGESGVLNPDGGLRVADRSYELLSIPAAGLRFDAHAVHLYQVGLCPSDFCSISYIDLYFRSDGQFARSAGISGTTGGTDYTALPPDKHGTYAIEAPGRIRLTFTDGRVETRAIAFLIDDAGRADPNKGIALDDTVYINTDD